ncbi:MAG: hypothetical protein K8T10_11455 [Candidatus Eremiobacteraeota bacterium]|nr:hypothetical protein [Candidatus Eremiobacteraeota bacterium]
MKKRKFVLTFLLLFVAACLLPAFAAGSITPGAGIGKAKLGMGPNQVKNTLGKPVGKPAITKEGLVPLDYNPTHGLRIFMDPKTKKVVKIRFDAAGPHKDRYRLSNGLGLLSIYSDIVKKMGKGSLSDKGVTSKGNKKYMLDYSGRGIEFHLVQVKGKKFVYAIIVKNKR